MRFAYASRLLGKPPLALEMPYLVLLLLEYILERFLLLKQQIIGPLLSFLRLYLVFDLFLEGVDLLDPTYLKWYVFYLHLDPFVDQAECQIDLIIDLVALKMRSDFDVSAAQAATNLLRSFADSCRLRMPGLRLIDLLDHPLALNVNVSQPFL